jgi:GNAT superfamily N-acetyltransferase
VRRRDARDARADYDDVEGRRGRSRGGHGGALLAAAIAAAPGLGCARLSLITDRLLPWNAPFYARRGFVAVAADEAPVPPWLAAKLLPQPGDGLDPARRCLMVRSL